MDIGFSEEITVSFTLDGSANFWEVRENYLYSNLDGKTGTFRPISKIVLVSSLRASSLGGGAAGGGKRSSPPSPIPKRACSKASWCPTRCEIVGRQRPFSSLGLVS